MKAVIFLACVAFAAAVPFRGGYQQKHIWIDEYGKIWVTSQGWKVMIQKPMEHMGHVEVIATGDDGYHRQVVIDHQFQIVKDSYLGHEYQFSDQYTGYPELGLMEKYFSGFDQWHHLYNFFREYIGLVEQQVWYEVLGKLLDEVHHGKVHYIIHEILSHFDQPMGDYNGFHQHQYDVALPNYQTIEEHIQHARDMYHHAQRILALFEQYGPEYVQDFTQKAHLQYIRDFVHVAQSNLHYLLDLQQNPEYMRYGIYNPRYGRNELSTGLNDQHEYVESRIHYMRLQLIRLHHKSQEIFQQQRMITDQITQLQRQFQNQGDLNHPMVEQLRQLYHQLGMLVHQQVALQIWIQQLHRDLDVQVHHWKQVMPYHHQVYPEHHFVEKYQTVYPEYQGYKSYPEHQMYSRYDPTYWYGGVYPLRRYNQFVM